MKPSNSKFVQYVLPVKAVRVNDTKGEIVKKVHDRRHKYVTALTVFSFVALTSKGS